MERLFLETFSDCRMSFRAAAQRLQAAGLILEGGQLAIPAARDNAGPEQAVDFILCSAAPDPASVVVLSCGLHGAEGHAGSAVMRDFLEGPAEALIRSGLGVLALHGLNPFGFDNFRRTTGSNVDLNRNFDTDGRLYDARNPTYTRLHSTLCPSRPVTARDLDTLDFGVRLQTAAGDVELRTLSEGVARGQYEHPDGLYFGGRGPEPLTLLIRPLVRRLLASAERVLSIDLHTGFGRRGMLHFFPDASARGAQVQIDRLFAGFQIDWGDTGDFYSVTGEFVTSVGSLCPPGAVHVPMVFELGTLDSHTPEGGLLSIHTLALENQAHFRGSSSEAVALEVKRRFREMFFPSDPDWRESVRRQASAALDVVLPRLLVGF